MSAIMDPTGVKPKDVAAGLTLAPRAGGLEGARIGLLENGKLNASLLLTEVAAVLRDRYGAADATLRRKEVFSQPAPAELVDELSAEADVVVVGVGD